MHIVIIIGSLWWTWMFFLNRVVFPSTGGLKHLLLHVTEVTKWCLAVQKLQGCSGHCDLLHTLLISCLGEANSIRRWVSAIHYPEFGDWMVSWQSISWTQTFPEKSISFMSVSLWKFKDAFSELIMASLPISKSQALKHCPSIKCPTSISCIPVP